MIKSIIFDWGGVLIDNPSQLLLDYCAKSLGVGSPQLLQSFSAYSSSFHRGVISEQELWQKVCAELDVKEPVIHSLWEDAVRAVFQDKTKVHKLILRLRENGYKIALLSNTEVPTVRYFYDHHYDTFFDVVVFSCVEHLLKPEKCIYLSTLQRLGVLPSEALFIDDRQENVEGARRVGIQSILFQNIRQLKEELAGFSVNIF